MGMLIPSDCCLIFLDAFLFSMFLCLQKLIMLFTLIVDNLSLKHMGTLKDNNLLPLGADCFLEE